MKTKKDYSWHIVIVIIIAIALIGFLASCEKPSEKFTFKCTVTVQYFINSNCAVVYSYDESHTMTESEHISWIHFTERTTKQISGIDTVVVVTQVDKCGKLVCPE